MAATDFIVAIELGSTQVTGVAGKKNSDGSIRILAHACEYSSDCIRKGVIYNLDKTTQCLASVIHRLEDTLEASIKKVYVGVGGQSIRSIRNTESRQLDEETKISQALIDELLAQNARIPLIDQEILAVEPQEYKIGNNQLTTEPVGIPTDRIEGKYLNVIARNTLKTNIKQCIRQAGYEVAEYFLSPIVTANTVLTDSERRSGCVLVDFGADTTTVVVYKNNLLRHLAVIPLGSSNITKDICTLQIEEEDAEQLKLRFASAYVEPAEEEDLNKEYTIEGHCSIRAGKLETIVEARVKEILENIRNQILISDYSDKLLAGAVLTGGASKLPELAKAFTKVTGIEKTRLAWSGSVELQGEVQLRADGSSNTLVGILLAGKENCCKLDPNHLQKSIFDEMRQREEEEKARQERLLQQEKEAQEQAEKAARLKQLEEEKIRQEQERANKRLIASDTLIAEAETFIGKRKFKSAMASIEEARKLNVPEHEARLDSLEAEIEKQKKTKNPFQDWIDALKKGADNFLKDE